MGASHDPALGPCSWHSVEGAPVEGEPVEGEPVEGAPLVALVRGFWRWGLGGRKKSSSKSGNVRYGENGCATHGRNGGVGEKRVGEKRVGEKGHLLECGSGAAAGAALNAHVIFEVAFACERSTSAREPWESQRAPCCSGAAREKAREDGTQKRAQNTDPAIAYRRLPIARTCRASRSRMVRASQHDRSAARHTRPPHR